LQFELFDYVLLKLIELTTKLTVQDFARKTLVGTDFKVLVSDATL